MCSTSSGSCVLDNGVITVYKLILLINFDYLKSFSSMHKVIETHFGIQVSCWSLMFRNKNLNVHKTCREGLPEE